MRHKNDLNVFYKEIYELEKASLPIAQWAWHTPSQDINVEIIGGIRNGSVGRISKFKYSHNKEFIVHALTLEWPGTTHRRGSIYVRSGCDFISVVKPNQPLVHCHNNTKAHRASFTDTFYQDVMVGNRCIIHTAAAYRKPARLTFAKIVLIKDTTFHYFDLVTKKKKRKSLDSSGRCSQLVKIDNIEDLEIAVATTVLTED